MGEYVLNGFAGTYRDFGKFFLKYIRKSSENLIKSLVYVCIYNLVASVSDTLF